MDQQGIQCPGSVTPFGETVAPSAWVSLPSRDCVLRRVNYVLSRAAGPVILHGASGGGKSLTARVLAARWHGPTHLVPYPALPPLELIIDLVEGLSGQRTPIDSSLTGALRKLRELLSHWNHRGVRPLLILDDAHLVDSAETWAAVRMIQNVSTLGTPDLAVLLVGATELVVRLPRFLSERVSTRCLLGPIEAAEMPAYLIGRVSREPVWSTSEVRRVFPEDVLFALHRAARGMPRAINQLADLSLLLAWAAERSAVSLPDVQAACAELHTAASPS